MSEMEERVAKAIRDAMDSEVPMEGDYSVLARAAIEAMRKPTDAMVEAGDIWADGPGYSAKVLDAMIDVALGKVDA